MDLRFHRSNFRYRFQEMIAKIADLAFFASRFPTLSVFAASVPSLLLGQFLLFVPENGFLFFGYRVIKLGMVLRDTSPCTTWMHVCVFIRRFGLTARIQSNVPDFSFLIIFRKRGKISWVFSCWPMSDFVGILPRRFSLCVAGPVQRGREIESSSADSGCSARKNSPGSCC